MTTHFCKNCGEAVEPCDAPLWKDFMLFGVTWIFGRWGKFYPDQCAECQQAAYDAGFERGYVHATEEAVRG